MMAVHELGHVLGAWATGAEVTKVVLHPLTISRTELGVNPRPLVVVWAGPLLGVVAPGAIWGCLRLRKSPAAPYAMFFTGFCLIANGIYIGAGWLGRVGDCGVMLQHGTPPWVMVAFGLATAPAGLLLWHRLGSLLDFLRHPERTPTAATRSLAPMLLLLLAVACLFSPR